MVIAELEGLSRYDVLWLAPHPFDALLSGTGRLLRARAQNLRTLIVTVFGAEQRPEIAAAIARLGADHLPLRLDAAHRRDRFYASFATRAFSSHASDAACHDHVRHLIEDLGHRSKAHDVYAPLGVGGNIDHRLLHEASASVFPVGPGQNLFFYEDRPYAYVPGAVRMRLGQLAIRLPPALTDVGDRSWGLRHVYGFMRSPVVRANLTGVREWARCLGLAWIAWHGARGWKPRKAFGLRVQPIVDPVDASLARESEELIASLGPAALRLIGSPQGLSRLASAYTRRLRQPGLVERYWLRLPALATDAVTSLTEPEMAPPLP
jgi:hypothetical protein